MSRRAQTVLTARRKSLERVAESKSLRWLRWASGSATFTPTVLRNAIALAGRIDTVIDVGASDGRWSKRTAGLLPETTRFLLFEANPVHERALNDLAMGEQVSPVFAAASDHVGEVAFHLDPHNPLGGGASAHPTETHGDLVPSTTVDAEVASLGLRGPFLMKLDAQGHEVEIFRGATRTLEHTALLVVETYFVDEPGRPAFDEICRDLRGLGFRAAGMADFMVRPSDGMSWQMDTYFLRADHAAFADRRFH